MRLAFVIMLVAMAMPAVAAEPAPAASAWAPLIEYVAAAIAGVMLGLISHAAQKLFGVTLEARHREALHSALTTGASLALSMIAELIAQGLKPGEARSVALQAGVDHVRESVPDALRVLKPADDMLFNMVRARSAQLELIGNPRTVLELGSIKPTVAMRG